MEKTKIRIPTGKEKEVCDAVSNIVSGYFGNPDFLDKNRKRENVKLRQITHFILSQNTTISLSKIGKYVANKDHSTVLHSVKTVLNDCETDRQYGDDLSVTNMYSIMVINEIAGKSREAILDIVKLRDSISSLYAIINGNEFGKKSLDFIVGVLKQRVPEFINT